MLCRWWRWGSAGGSRRTFRAAGTFWMVCWCSCPWWTSWCLWPHREGTRSWASSASCASSVPSALSGRPRPGLAPSPRPACVCLCVCVCLYMCVCFQGDQQSSRSEAGGGDSHHVSQAHRKHRPHLLCILHRVWNTGGAGSTHTQFIHSKHPNPNPHTHTVHTQ